MATLDKQKLHDFDPADYLQTPQDCAEYLTVAIEDDEGDGQTILTALRSIARAQELRLPPRA